VAFSEQVKLSVKKQAHFRCCLCHELFVEIHHIIPQSEGGDDIEANAAPLCPSCHEAYGANPEKRKFIRETRDFWYELCSRRYPIDREQMKDALAEALKNVATKDDLDRISIRNSSLVLGSSSSEGKIALDHLRYSFVREEYIHPRILRELRGWISDRNSTVVGIDLASANQSNQFYGDIHVSESDGKIWVNWTDENERFGYSYIASSPSGIHIVECSDWGGGSGVFGSVQLLGLNQDRCLDPGSPNHAVARDRILINILGQVPLGDRYSGEITYKNGLLVIGPDMGWFQRGEAAVQRIFVE
jgi:hypothetical protein